LNPTAAVRRGVFDGGSFGDPRAHGELRLAPDPRNHA
jgi:hypothetical protein